MCGSYTHSRVTGPNLPWYEDETFCNGLCIGSTYILTNQFYRVGSKSSLWPKDSLGKMYADRQAAVHGRYIFEVTSGKLIHV
jgi:hypothetical protein